MSNLQPPSAGAPPPPPSIPAIFLPSDEVPKPPSYFPLATLAIYGAYALRWNEVNDEFNAFAELQRVSYVVLLGLNPDGLYDEILELLVETVSEAKDALVANLGALEEIVHLWCIRNKRNAPVSSEAACAGVPIIY
ncbi:unnamed protein product [Tuber aestivum]|uniref:Uncharacterized protein n=1 Tax=Tuber aestivum TaxID=59557 RepID=A0A292Q0F9_9PEZI|nr:unnamed protein product [Tuber aestivum]